MPDLAHQNKTNLPTPCHFHLKHYFLLVKLLLCKQLLPTSQRLIYFILIGRTATLSGRARCCSSPWARKPRSAPARSLRPRRSACRPPLLPPLPQPRTQKLFAVGEETWSDSDRQSCPIPLSAVRRRQGMGEHHPAERTRGGHIGSPPLPETKNCASIMNQLLIVLNFWANHH